MISEFLENVIMFSLLILILSIAFAITIAIAFGVSELLTQLSLSFGGVASG